MQGVEERAESFLSGVPGYIWDGESLPVPIEDIADSHVGLLVRDVEDLTAAPGAPALGAGQALSGLLLPARGEIWVNAQEAREWPPRRRFTIAHELGHWQLHRHGGQGVYCRASVVDVEEPDGSPTLAEPEEEANEFAAALLMPARLIREQYEACDREFSLLCETFSSSGAAMGRRLHAVI